MRLLETRSYELFEASDIPSPFPFYAILSHTWISSKDEITYQDMKTRTGDIKNDVYKQKGWSKLREYCDRAANDGWEWAWMDTCCIDKTNPADTQEAINAMFRWYQNAGICYAHLGDVDVLKDIQGVRIPETGDFDQAVGSRNVANPNSPLHEALKSIFVNAKWFTRGWTLQELLAPHYLVFVDRAWRRIGTRESWALEIKQASNIEACHLTGFNPTDFDACSTAMRLSWASGRETTVEEDETYSLLGLFGISLPLIYGEGRGQAFNRLQRQLIMVYNDDSLFAWKEPQAISGHPLYPEHQASRSGCGILARSIRDFWDASKIKSLGHYGNAFSMTNRGLEITAKHWRHKRNFNESLIRLNCSVRSGSSAQDQEVGIYLIYDAGADVYHRMRIDELCDMNQIKHNDWNEERSREPILIRANNESNLLADLSMFVLKCPEQIKMTAKYAAAFGPSVAKHDIQLLGDGFHQELVDGVKIEELSVKPNSVIFLNIELDDEGTKYELDVIINLTQNCFPHVGILTRQEGTWERLGDPLGEAFDTYNALAEQIHFNLPSSLDYPVGAMEETENLVVCTHVLPKSPRKRLQNLGPESTRREYVLNISVGRREEENVERNTRQRSPETQETHAKRQRIS